MASAKDSARDTSQFCYCIKESFKHLAILTSTMSPSLLIARHVKACSKNVESSGMVSNKSMYAGSVKACYGHTEGAAGLQGALCSILSLQRSIVPPIMHLRSMNPYVSAAITDWAKSSGLQAAIPRVTLTCDESCNSWLLLNGGKTEAIFTGCS